MSEYIKREDALDAVLFALVGTGHQSKAIYAIREIPTADVVEVRHGRWLSAYEYAIKLGETNPYRLGIAEHDKIWHFCSLCEQQVRFTRNYCPDCGAKMDGERREENGI